MRTKQRAHKRMPRLGTKDKGQRTKDKGQRTKDKGQRAKGKGQRAKGKGQRAKGKGPAWSVADLLNINEIR